ncbi:hypothetical protein GCM10020370_66010 [Paenibacillus hodogayensis]
MNVGTKIIVVVFDLVTFTDMTFELLYDLIHGKVSFGLKRLNSILGTAVGTGQGHCRDARAKALTRLSR